MSRGFAAAGEPLADLPAEVVLSAPTLLAKGFRTYERFDFTVASPAGPLMQCRDVMRFGRVAAMLPLDLARDRIVLVRQFRLPAHLASGNGWLVEIVAGHVEHDEMAVETARRECVEEIGIAPAALIELFTYLPTPGLSDEEITLFLGLVDSTQVPAQAGAPSEGEVTLPFASAIDSALDALNRGTLRNGPLIIALQWLALNRARLPEIVRAGAARA